MLLQQAASSSAFVVVLRVTPATCPWTLLTSTSSMCTAHRHGRRRRSINENRRTAYGVEQTWALYGPRATSGPLAILFIASLSQLYNDFLNLYV